MSSTLRARLKTVAIGAAGAALFWALGLPLPFLFGPMAATLVAALAGVRLASMGVLSTAARAVIGVMVGTMVSPAMLEVLPQMAASVAIMPFYLLVIAAVGVPFLRRVHGLDPVTAFFGAMPGGLSDMVILGHDAGGDVRALSLIQATRVVILIAIAAPMLALAFGATFTGPVGAPAGEIPLRDLALMVLAGVVGAVGGQRIGLFGAAMIGPLLLTAALSLSGLIESCPPREAVDAAQFLIGVMMGVFYVGVTFGELRRYVLSGVAYSFILAVLTTIFAEAVALMGLAPPLEAFLAFAPGGQAELTVLALAVGADITYIVAHHMVRVILIITAAPVAARIFGMKRR